MRTALGILVNDPEFFYIGPNPKAYGYSAFRMDAGAAKILIDPFLPARRSTHSRGMLSVRTFHSG